MSAHRLYRRQVLDRPLEEVFPFFRDPFNLELLTPPWLRFRILLATERPIRVGTRIRYRLSLHGIPFSWESVITEYEEGVCFADEQVQGPYQWWHHRHRFTPEGDRVVIEDLVDYGMPFGPLGALVHSFVVREQLRRIFEFRVQAIAARFPQHPRVGEESIR